MNFSSVQVISLRSGSNSTLRTKGRNGAYNNTNALNREESLKCSIQLTGIETMITDNA